jgi:PmbA protein
MMDQKTQEAIAQKVLAMAKAAGATAADVAVRSSESVSVDVLNGQYDEMSSSFAISIDLEVYNGQKKSAGSGTDISDAGLQKLVNATVANLKFSDVDPYDGIPPAAQQSKTWKTELQAMDLEDPNGMPSVQKLVDAAMKMDKTARAVKGIETVNTGAGFTLSQGTMAMSNGFMATFRKTSGSLGIATIAGTDVNMVQNYDGESVRHWSDLPDPASIALLATEKTLAMQNKGVLTADKAGKIPVIFSPAMARSVLLKNLASSLSGSTVASKKSFLAGKLGTKVFGSNLTVISDRARVRGMGSFAFDGHGIAGPEQLNMVNNGVVENLFLGFRSANKLNDKENLQLQPNGRGSAGNLYIVPGNTTVDDLFNSVGDGFYLTEVMGHGFQVTNGDLAYTASGYIIRGGKKCEYVTGLGISGNLGDALSNLTIADDFTEKYNTPTILVEGMSISV